MHAASKVVDNGDGMDYNVSISYSVSASQFSQIENFIADPPGTYDLINFNCTDFITSACNAGDITLPNPLSTVGLSGAGNTTMSETPAGLGASIEDMKGQSNVNTNGGLTPFSHGPC